MGATEAKDLAKNVGLVGLLSLIIWTSFSGIWVWKTQLQEEQTRTVSALADRDKWQKLALQGTKLAEEASLKDQGLPMATAGPVDTNVSADEVAQRLNKVNLQVHPGIE